MTSDLPAWNNGGGLLLVCFVLGFIIAVLRLAIHLIDKRKYK